MNYIWLDPKKGKCRQSQGTRIVGKWLLWELPISGIKYESWRDKIKIQWRKRALKYEISYVIENQARMICIHDNKVNNIDECNLLHDIINPPKRAKNIKIH